MTTRPDHEGVLPHAIADLSRSRADQPAIIDVTGTQVTYGELHEQALRWAAAFERLGVREGDTVVTMLPNSLLAYYAWLGLGWLRALEVPVNNMYRGSMLRYITENAGAEVVVISARFVDRLAEVADQLTTVKTVVVVDAGPEQTVPDLPFQAVRGDWFLDGVDPYERTPGPSDADIMAIIYTSGTTGPSKGVLVPWAELRWFALSLPDDMIRPGDRYYSPYPNFHLSGKSALGQTALVGATLVIRESFSVSSFWDDLRAHDVGAIALLGPLATMLLRSPEQENDADNPVHSMACAPVIPEIEAFKRRFAIERHSTGFGMTEIGVPITAGWNPPNTATCGRPRQGRPGYEVRIVDEYDKPVPTGSVGELVVRCSEPWCMNVGYWNMPEETARAWRNGWFHTGDGFRADEEGWLYFVDRLKDSIRRRGENISSFEVEAAILEHPGVRECAVIGVPSELSEDDVLAYVVPAEDAALTEEALLRDLVPRMPRFMLPRYIRFVDELPRTEATFRVRKAELRRSVSLESCWDREAAGFSWEEPD
jgi:crotonobetaine/carnitine-CoA ligase